MMQVQFYSDDLLMNLTIPLFFFVFFFSAFAFITYLSSLGKRGKKYSCDKPVSVIIPMYNEEKNISRCLDSLDFGDGGMEVICVDDGSTDKTLEIVKKYDLKVLRQKHKGKAEALNLAMKHTKHELILVLDADTRITKGFIKKLIAPFSDKKVGATSGVCLIDKKPGVLGWFQEVEYLYINLIRTSFSSVFGNGIWFFGAASCFRKALVGRFEKVLTEDMEVSLRIAKAGYKVLTVEDAVYYTDAVCLPGLVKQRMRWFFGGLQCIGKHKYMFLRSTEITYLYANQVFWALYSVIILPIVTYQVIYWLPQAGVFGYLLRWFSLFGPLYVIYMMPVWGLSFLNIFGISTGILTATMLFLGHIRFGQRLTLSRLVAVIFYFPYTLLLNAIFLCAIITYTAGKKVFLE